MRTRDDEIERPQTTLHGAADCLTLLARAVQQFHTYPPASSMCVNAVETARRSLTGMPAERLSFRVAPHELLVDDQPLGRGTVIDVELARRLHVASIAEVTLETAASTRELTRFCEALLHCGERSHDERTLPGLLASYGVERITLRPACRPEVLPVTTASPAVADLVDHERARRQAQLATAGAVNHLYPPEKGWVRLDPAAAMDSVSLVELALLATDPLDLAHMLTRLTDGEEAGLGADALERRYSDVAMLFSAMDARVARMMFARLARAVLDLDPDHRQSLLRRTILPGLLDGKVDGTVLRDFPDLELADALCLLLDIETAAPEVISAALSRLDLPAERQSAVTPLIEDRLAGRQEARSDTTVHTHARKLLRIDAQRPKRLAEFAAFDLALDDEARATLASLRTAVAATDVAALRLECVWRLVRLEPNPETVERLLARLAAAVQQFERDSRLGDSARQIARHRALASELREQRPDVAEALDRAHAAFCTADRAARLLARAEQGDDGMADASAMIEALGSAIAGPILAHAKGVRARIAADLILEHAALLAPALTDVAETLAPQLRRIAARVFGFAGAGFELPLSRLLRSDDEQTVREALRALARIGTTRAASLVAAEMGRAGWIALAAEQTLWQFPRVEAQRQALALLAEREFVLRQPAMAERLLERTPRSKVSALIGSLEGLRFRFWNPSVARLGRKAHTFLAAR